MIDPKCQSYEQMQKVIGDRFLLTLEEYKEWSQNALGLSMSYIDTAQVIGLQHDRVLIITNGGPKIPSLVARTEHGYVAETLLSGSLNTDWFNDLIANWAVPPHVVRERLLAADGEVEAHPPEKPFTFANFDGIHKRPSTIAADAIEHNQLIQNYGVLLNEFGGHLIHDKDMALKLWVELANLYIGKQPTLTTAIAGTNINYVSIRKVQLPGDVYAIIVVTEGDRSFGIDSAGIAYALDVSQREALLSLERATALTKAAEVDVPPPTVEKIEHSLIFSLIASNATFLAQLTPEQYQNSPQAKNVRGILRQLIADVDLFILEV